VMKYIDRIKSRIYLSPLYDLFGKRSYAQSGEDIISWLEIKNSRTQEIKKSRQTESKGFYVDIGAYHPKLFSNTYLFYKKGWRGICVDPNPRMEELYRKARPRDVFVNVGVGDVDGVRLPRFGVPKLAMTNEKASKVTEMEYYMFEDGAANTFSAEQARKNQEVGRKLIGKRTVAVLPLEKILEKYLPKGQKIDLLSVDVEGMDLEVLKSNDWKKYRPKMVICEDLAFDLDKWMRRLRGKREGFGVGEFLMEKGYRLTAKTPYSLIFKRKTVE